MSPRRFKLNPVTPNAEGRGWGWGARGSCTPEMSTAGTALPVSPARRKVLRPCPIPGHQHPRPRRFIDHQAPRNGSLQAP